MDVPVPAVPYREPQQPAAGRVFDGLLRTHSWSAVKHDLYGLRFFYLHVLGKPWPDPGLIKPPKTQRLPDILSIAEAERVFDATRVRSYRAFFFTLYSLGLRLGEGLRLRVGDIDAGLGRVHIRDSKGNRDRFVPLPARTLSVLREFWSLHRNAHWLFPARQSGAAAAALPTKPLDRGAVCVHDNRPLPLCAPVDGKPGGRISASGPSVELIQAGSRALHYGKTSTLSRGEWATQQTRRRWGNRARDVALITILDSAAMLILIFG